MKALVLAFIASLCTFVPSGRADILWDELVNGPFSNNFTSPTALGPLFNPTSEVFGIADHSYEGNGNYTVTNDYFTFTVPVGFQLDAIFVTVNRPDLWIWVGTPDFANHAGFTFNATTGSLLPQLGLASLSEGTYGVYLQHTQRDAASSSSAYALSFSISAVPEPAVASLLALGLLTCCAIAAKGKRKG